MSIQLSSQYGVNPTVCICPGCGEDTGDIALLGKADGYECPEGHKFLVPSADKKSMGCPVEGCGYHERGIKYKHIAQNWRAYMRCIHRDANACSRTMTSDPCEFCFIAQQLFPEIYSEEEVLSGEEKQIAIAKIVDTEGELFAYVPMKPEDARKRSLIDGTEFILQHRLIIEAERVNDGVQMVKIKDKGIDKFVSVRFQPRT